MTLGEFTGAVHHDVYIKIELRNTENKKICTCNDDSPVIDVYADCEVIDWWNVEDNGRVIVHIDDTLVMRKLKKED